MGMDTRSGRMALSTKAITSTEQSMDMGRAILATIKIHGNYGSSYNGKIKYEEKELYTWKDGKVYSGYWDN